MTSPEPDDWTRAQPLGPPAYQGADPLTPTPPPMPLAPTHEPKGSRLPAFAAIAGAVALLAIGASAILLAFRSPGATPTPAPSPSTCHTIGANGCEDARADAINVSGTLTLTEPRGIQDIANVACTGTGGYDDIHESTEVTVTDQAGTVIGVSRLEYGRLIGSGATRECEFAFHVINVPLGKSFYAVSVGRRGSIHFTESQIRESVHLQLGG